MPSAYTWITIADFNGGRNGADDPLDLREHQVREARNGDWHRSTGFAKRPGSTSPAMEPHWRCFSPDARKVWTLLSS